MKRITLLLVFVLSISAILQAQENWPFKGTVIKMRMTDCVLQHGFISTMSGVSVVAGSTCPEYTVMGDKVVYVVVALRTDQFIPLSENMNFLIRKNELVIVSDDEKKKPRFAIQQMMLRADWEREEARKDVAARMMERSANYESRNPARNSLVSASAR